MKGTSFIVVGILLCGVFASSAFADPCEELLAEGISHPDPRLRGDDISEGSLITYLSLLLEQNLIGDTHLVRFSEGLERGEVVNPISEEEARADFRLGVQRPGLDYLIQSDGLDHRILLEWTQEKLSERKIVQVQREVVHQETKIPFQPMEFVPIQPGLKKPYAMSMFLATQWQYAMVMGINPSKFVEGFDAIEIEIHGKKIRMQPNHPVESVSWNDIHELFLPKLNALSRADDPLIYKVIPDHIPGKIYRLPKDEEWERAARAGTDTMYSFGDDEAELPQYAWFAENAKRQTHAVGLKKPNPWGLYDMHGNVLEWMKDWHDSSYSASNTTDPIGHSSGSHRVIRGGSWNNDAPVQRSAYRYHYGPEVRSYDVGFRLVREE